MKQDLIHFLQSVKSGDTLEDRSRLAKRVGSTLKDVSLRELPRSLIPSDSATVSCQNPDMSPDKTGCDGEVGLGHSSAWWYHKGKRGQDARVSGLAETWVHKERAAGPGK